MPPPLWPGKACEDLQPVFTWFMRGHAASKSCPPSRRPDCAQLPRSRPRFVQFYRNLRWQIFLVSFQFLLVWSLSGPHVQIRPQISADMVWYGMAYGRWTNVNGLSWALRVGTLLSPALCPQLPPVAIIRENPHLIWKEFYTTMFNLNLPSILRSVEFGSFRFFLNIGKLSLN